MPVSMETLILGEEYDRYYLAKLWGYASHHAIGRGIVTPRGAGLIILFITHEKQSSSVQYRDYFEDGVLHIDGETSHANDQRILDAAAGDQIYLFFRGRHHRPFVFFGSVTLLDYQINIGSEPSTFSFSTSRFEALATSALLTEVATHGDIEDHFVPESEGRRLLREHVTYERSPKNRARAIEIHGTVCAVCRFDFDALYGQDFARSYIEIHHIRSLAEQGERIVDPAIDLVPLCSNCHSMAHRKRGDIVPLDELRQLVEMHRHGS